MKNVSSISKGRIRAFRILAGLLGILALGGSLPFTVASMVVEDQSIHRMHSLAGTLAFGVLLGVPLLLCAWRPEEAIGPFWVALGSGVASTIAGLISGDFVTGTWFIAPVTVVILLVLHPARPALRPHGADAATVALGALAFVPALAWALTQSRLQRSGLPGDPHWEAHHYSGMVEAGLAIPLTVIACALRVRWRRVGAWLVGLSAAGLGLGSLLLSDHLGAFDPLWAWLAVSLGIAVIAVAEIGTRTRATAVELA